MKRRTLLSALAMALATPLTAALAQGLDKMPILFCKTSQGCWQGQSHVTPDELRVLLGDQVPAAATSQTHTIVYVDGNSDPVVSDMPASEINRLYGGSDAIADIWLANPGGGGQRPDGAVTAEELGISPQATLFYPQSPQTDGDASSLVPLDGLWSAKPREFSFKTCNSMLEQMLGGALAGIRSEETRHIVWNGRFDPHKFDFVNGENQSVSWTQIGAHKYTGRLVEVSEDQTHIFSDLTLTLISERLIDATSLLNIQSLLGGAGGAEMDALGFSDCEITMHFDLMHVGD